MHKRWAALKEFVGLLYEQPLRAATVAQAEGPRALLEWDAFSADRYRDKGMVVLSVGTLKPPATLDPDCPQRWLGVAEGLSGTEYWFVDAESDEDDPPVWTWDAAFDPQPTPAFACLSDLLTWLVVSETLRAVTSGKRRGPLGSLGPNVSSTVCDDEELLTKLELSPWVFPEIELLRSADGSVLAHDTALISLTAQASEFLDQHVKAKADAQSAEHRSWDEVQRETEEARSLAITRKLKTVGTGISSPEGLLEALTEIEDKLPLLDRVFLQDFRMRVNAGGVFDSQRIRAAELLVQHGRPSGR